MQDTPSARFSRDRLPPGTRLNGIYEIEHLIAAGGMGEVYKGCAIQTGHPVAIKLMLPEMAENEAAMLLFRKEASALHHIHHEAIVRYYVFTVEPTLQRPYLAMEFVEGESLSEMVKRGPLSFEAVWALKQRLAAGLQAAHERGIVHRDVSPDNVIVPGGDISRAKIIDFGIARSTQLGDATVIGSGFAGKFNYVSPEQLGLFGGDVTAKSDVYSLGLLLVEALTGRAIDMGGTQLEIIEKRRRVPDQSAVDTRIPPLIERMLQPVPADRPASMAEVASWAPSVPMRTAARADARARSDIQGTARKRSGGRRLALGAAAVLLIAGAGAAVYHLELVPPGMLSSQQTVAPPKPAPLLRPNQQAALPPAPALGPEPAARPEPPSPTAPPAPSFKPAPPVAAPAPRLEPAPPPASAAVPPPGRPPASTAPAKPEVSPLATAPPLLPVQPAPSPAAPPPLLDPAPPAPALHPPPKPGALPRQEEKTALLPPKPAPPVPLSPTERITRYITQFDGGECFFVMPVAVSAQAARIEGYGAAIEPFVALDSAFKRDNGFEADIGLRQVTKPQCPAVTFLGRVRGDRGVVPQMTISPTSLKSGEALSGNISAYGDRHVELLLVSDEGSVQNLTRLLKPSPEGKSFNLRMQRTGAPGAQPQLLLAVSSAKPLDALQPRGSVEAGLFFPLVLGEAERQGQALGAKAMYFRLDQ